MINVAARIAINQILSAIKICLNVSEEQIRSGHREQDNIMDARKIFVASVYFMEEETSPTELGKFLRVSHSPHSRINYYKNKHADHYEVDYSYRSKYDEVIEYLFEDGSYEINKEYKTELAFLEAKKSEIRKKIIIFGAEYRKVNNQLHEHIKQREAKAGIGNDSGRFAEGV